MKLAVTSQGPDVTSQIDPRFGRARYFIVVDTDSGQIKPYDNRKNINAMQGAGIQASRSVIELEAAALITGHKRMHSPVRSVKSKRGLPTLKPSRRRSDPFDVGIPGRVGREDLAHPTKMQACEADVAE